MTPSLMIKPWMLVALGIAFNIASALMIYIVVEQNMRTIESLSERSLSVNERIDSTWQNYLRLERKEDFLLSLLLTAPKANIETFIGDELALLATKYTPILAETSTSTNDHTIDLAGVRQAIRIMQRQLLNDIDAVYLEQLDTQRSRHQLESINQRWRSAALFLQLLGLILVLARDLARRE